MRNALTGAVILLASFASVPASAQGFWYLGGSAGYQSSDISRSRFSEPLPSCRRPNFTPGFADCVVDEDSGDGSYSLFAGYQATKYLGIELAYADLGNTFDVRVVDPLVTQPGFFDVEQDTRAFTARAVLTLPLSQVTAHEVLQPLSVSGVLGMTHWQSDITYISDPSGTPGFTRLRLSDKDSGNDLMLGARVNYDFTRQIRVMGTWDHYTDVGSASSAVVGSFTTPPTSVDAVRGSVNVFSLGVSYRFH